MLKGSLYVDQYVIQYSDTLTLTCDLLLDWYENTFTSQRQETLYQRIQINSLDLKLSE